METKADIRNIVFDFGGIIFPLNFDRAVKRFEEIGLTNASTLLDRYKQRGIFGDLEDGSISPEEFLMQLSQLAGCKISEEACQWAWMGYVDNIPTSHFKALRQLHDKGYHLTLLSNINPYVMSWAFSNHFDGEGHDVRHYFEHLFLSYQCGVMKPSPKIFQLLLAQTKYDVEATLFIDDGQKNIAMGEKLGFQTFLSRKTSDWLQLADSLPNLKA